MAACAGCGAEVPENASACPSCGRAAEAAAKVTRPIGSPGEGHPAATLMLGSGVSLEQVRPAKPEPRAQPAQAEPARVAKPSPRPESERPRPLPQPERLDRRRFEKRLPPKHEPALHASDIAVLPRRASRRTLVAVLSAVALAGLAIAIVLLAVARRAPAIVPSIGFDERGRPELALSCADCADGTRARAGAGAATFSRGKAELPLEPPISVGQHHLSLELERPDGRTRTLSLEVPVSWVVSADLRGLAQPIPHLAVVVDAKSDVGVVVAGHVLPATQSGTRRYEIDVRSALTGPSPSVMPLKRRVSYAITPASGSVVRGELELATEIVPLRIDAPGDSIVTETTSFTLAGSTQSDATVSVEGRPITVDPAGRFAQLMSVSAVGDTTVTVRASAPGRAPRLFPIRVKRVTSLKDEGDIFARRATSSYSAVADDPDGKLGWAVVLGGKVVEVKSDGYASSVLLDVTTGCPKAPCLARLTLGSRIAFAAGSNIVAYGHVAGKSSAGDGRSVPEVRVEFVRGQP